LINFSLLYNDPRSGLGFSALYNRIGERINVVGNRTIPTTWEKGRNVIDIQVSKSVLKKRGELKLTVTDLLNQPYIFYWNYDGKDSYNESNDRVFRQYQYGTTFTLGFTYRLVQ
jgi:outer membrane receptor protein involved in Fe transport